MKKITTTLALMLISILSHAQVFMGIHVSGPIASFTQQIRAKGFTLNLQESQGNIYVYNGTLSGTTVEVIAVTTPTSKVVKKVAVFYPIQESWYSLKSDFTAISERIVNKYGQPNDTYSFFESPYEEGDGYEMTGVAVEKCFYLSVWKASAAYPNQTIAVRITKAQRVSLVYENDALMEKSEIEQQKIDQSTY